MQNINRYSTNNNIDFLHIPLSDEDAIVQFFDSLSIQTKTGTLGESEISSTLAVHLITYMLINSEKKISQRELINILWPNSEVASPIKQVQNVVHRTRKILYPIFPCNLILSDRSGNYYINPDLNIITDIDSFSYYFHNGMSHMASPDKKIEYLLQAVQLYKNDFLPNYVGNNWLDNQRTYYHLTYLQAVLHLFPLLYQTHAYLELYTISSNALLHEPDNSDIHYWHIRAMHDLGGLDIAQKHFLQHTQKLSEEQQILLGNILFKKH